MCRFLFLLQCKRRRNSQISQVQLLLSGCSYHIYDRNPIESEEIAIGNSSLDLLSLYCLHLTWHVQAWHINVKGKFKYIYTLITDKEATNLHCNKNSMHSFLCFIFLFPIFCRFFNLKTLVLLRCWLARAEAE